MPEMNASRLADAELALALCPSSFTSRQEALDWSGRIDAGLTHLKPDCRFLALQIRARSAIWSNDHSAAAWCLKRSLQIDLSTVPHLAIERWFAGAYLAADRAETIPPIENASFDSLPLCAAFQALGQPANLDDVTEAVETIQAQGGRLNIIQAQTASRLLQDVLSLNFQWSPQELHSAAEVCRSIINRKWAPACCAVTRAAADISAGWIDVTLAEERVRSHTDDKAVWLKRVLRILRGASDAPMDGDESFLAANERAQRALLGPSCDLTRSEIDEIRQQLLSRDEAAARWFPSFSAAAGLLRWSLAVHNRDTTATLVNIDAEQLPDWGMWLLARTEVASPAPLPKNIPPSLIAACAAQQWSRDCLDRQLHSEHLAQSHNILQQFESELDDNEIIAWREFMCGIDGPSCDTPAKKIVQRGGAFIDTIAQTENEIAQRISECRQQCRDGHNHQASRRLRREIRELSDQPLVISATWIPRLQYWLAMSEVPKNPDIAEDLWAKSSQSVQSSITTVQLALLAIQAGRWSRAHDLLASARANDNCTVYAYAVLAAHRHDFDESIRRLDEFDSCDRSGQEPWHTAARRLRGAVSERQGQLEQAETVYRDLLRARPKDSVTSARLARLLLAKLAAGNSVLSPDQRREVQTLLNNAHGIPWATRLNNVLHSLSNSDQPATSDADSPATRALRHGMSAITHCTTGRFRAARDSLAKAKTLIDRNHVDKFL